MLTNAFSSEFGWTSGPALNIVTKSGTNDFHGEGLFMVRPAALAGEAFSTKNFCPPSVSSCVTPTTLTVDQSRSIFRTRCSQFSGSIGGPIIKDKTFFFVTADYTRQNRTTFLSTRCRLSCCRLMAISITRATIGSSLFDGRLDHKFTSNQTLMFRFNVDRFSDDNPQDAVGGTSAPSVARRYSRARGRRRSITLAVISPHLLNEARVRVSPRRSGDAIGKRRRFRRLTHARGAVPFTIGQSRASESL